MKSMNHFLTPVAPDGPHPRDPERYGGGNEPHQSRRVHNGMTVSERVAAGVGSQQDIELVRRASEQHRAWLLGPEGRAWVATERAAGRLP